MPDLDGAIAEYRQALRLDPNDARTHFWLGWSFETKGDMQVALQEYRVAYELDPKDSVYRYTYERLLQQVNK